MEKGGRIPAKKYEDIIPDLFDPSCHFHHIIRLVMPVQRQTHGTDLRPVPNQFPHVEFTVQRPFNTQVNHFDRGAAFCGSIIRDRKESHGHVCKPDKVSNGFVKIIEFGDM